MEHPWIVEVDDDETDHPVSQEPDNGLDMDEKGL